MRYYTDAINDVALRERLRRACADDGYYTSLLRDDVSYVLPYGTGRDEGFVATLTGNADRSVTELITNSLDPDSRGHVWLAPALRDFINQAAQLLVTCGPLTYEVDFLSTPDADPPGAPFAFELALVQPGSLDAIGGEPIQYVPRPAGEAVAPNGLAYVRLNPKHLVTIRLDAVLERQVADAVRFLQAADEQQVAEFNLTQKAMQESTTYEPMTHVNASGELIAIATRPIGWNARGLFQDNRLDPYVTWRSLRFLAFKIRLREAVLEGINAALAIAGSVMGFENALKLDGVPTLDDVEAGIAGLEEGTASITELLRLDFGKTDTDTEAED